MSYEDLLAQIYKELPQHGAHFPYPQLDVHITSRPAASDRKKEN